MKKMFIVMVALLLTTVSFGQEDLLNLKYEFSQMTTSTGTTWGEIQQSSGYVRFYEDKDDYDIHIHIHKNDGALHLDLILNNESDVKDGSYNDLTKLGFPCIVVKDYNGKVVANTKFDLNLWRNSTNTKASFTLMVGGIQYLFYVDTLSKIGKDGDDYPIETKKLEKW